MVITVKDVIELIRILIWPLTGLLIFVLLRQEIRALFSAISQRATKFSGAGIAIEFAASQLEDEKLSEHIDPQEKAKYLRNLEIAKAIAPKFDFWMKHYNHPLGRTHSQELLDWLKADKGAKYISGDYSIFKTLAEVLHKMGYNTVPVPTEGEFVIALGDYLDSQH